MINRSAILGLNHILRQQDWPLARLKTFAGRTLCVRMAPLPDLKLAIREDGLLEESAQSGDLAPDLTITLKPAALPRLVQRDASALRDIELTGAADLAQLAQQLFRELRWDIEEDLSRVVGDVIAHRVVRAGHDFVAWQADAAQRLARNFADYWTDEHPLIVRKDAAAQFGAELTQAGNRVEALEARIASLERQGTRPPR